jgi:hypothetical protein
MNKHEIIKEYVLKDRDSFSLASDIYSSFWEIREFLKDSISVLLDSQIKSEIPNVKTTLLQGYTHNQYIDIWYKEKVKIQIQFWNFFKTPVLNISGTDDGLAKEISRLIPRTTISGDITQLTMIDYDFNKINELLGLYDLCNDENLKKKLKENFHNHVLIPVKTIYDATVRHYEKVS